MKAFEGWEHLRSGVNCEINAHWVTQCSHPNRGNDTKKHMETEAASNTLAEKGAFGGFIGNNGRYVSCSDENLLCVSAILALGR